jgi:hypothetical protein
MLKYSLFSRIECEFRIVFAFKYMNKNIYMFLLFFSFASVHCVECAYKQLCNLSPQSYSLKIEALLLISPIIWINASIDETSNFICKMESSLEELKMSFVSHLFIYL